jgi:RNA polymerase sigma factor (sigma-70 family)
MKAFLYHVLNGLIIDEYRKKKTMSLDMLFEKGFEPSVDEGEAVENVFDGKSAMTLISELPPVYQKTLRMRYEQDLSLTEIAKLTGKTKNTTAVHSHRGLEKLKVIYFSQHRVEV